VHAGAARGVGISLAEILPMSRPDDLWDEYLRDRARARRAFTLFAVAVAAALALLALIALWSRLWAGR
jgi:hypothetical protein